MASLLVEPPLSSYKYREQPFSDSLSDIRKELRQRRKRFLGSHVSVCEMVKRDGIIDESLIQSLCEFLTERTVPFWDNKHKDAKTFCFRFYELSVYSLLYGNLSVECIDDIIQLAECLVRSRKVFKIALKEMLPSNMIGELFDFTESYNDIFFTSSFEDAVLGSISVFLGVLSDPFGDSEVQK